MKRGAVRIGSDAALEDISHVAFRNPNGEFVLVVTTPGNTRTVGLKAGKTNAELTLAANSVATFTWAD